ncbi:Scavenger receptor cysteine-rich type 1 M130 [Paramuricea clavata]|uniref:Scavenger receptor cysteine-rich type 1 M130 n=1 Tax=Paramuricea clavata TaxID=317549 RepID=A0A7D9IWW1_PARCT|nr:Scavenger receptor cysteine-rich type 1 M130 [Paramuricea clavata]
MKTIYVNNSRSVTLCALEVESNTTAECVQNKIQEKPEIPSEQQRLFFTDKVLDVEKTLGGYEIYEATTYGEGLKITDKGTHPRTQGPLRRRLKGTLKWLGSFESLKYLVEKLQLPKAKWMTPGGRRWLEIGNKASEIKANFISILENEVEEISQSQDELQYNSDLHKDSIKTNGPSTNYPTCDSTCSNLEQYLLINDLMSKFMQKIDDKVEGISQEDAHKTAAGISDVNRYEVLSDSDVEPTEGQHPPYVRPITTHKNPGNKESTFDKTLITDSPPQNSYSKSKTSEGPITILGDSMIKMIKPPKLRQLSRLIGEKGNIKTFPGATINDMNHYIQPTMKKQPKLVILHVGTNDIQRYVKNPTKL